MLRGRPCRLFDPRVVCSLAVLGVEHRPWVERCNDSAPPCIQPMTPTERPHEMQSRRDSRSRCSVLFPVAILVGCSGVPATGSLATAAIDTLPGGVVQVVNHGPTRWVDTNGWRLVEIDSIAPLLGSAGELDDVLGAVGNDSGVVAVMQDLPVAIKLFDSSGEFFRTLGREGEGPGEFHSGASIGISGDTIVVQDPANSRMTIFLTDGTILGSYPTPCCHYARTLDIGHDGIAFLLGPAPGGSGMMYHRYDLRGETHGTVVIPRAPEPKMWRVPVGDAAMTLAIPLQGQMVVKVRPDGLLLYGTTDRYQFTLSRTGSDTLREIVATAPVVPLAPGQRDSVFEAALRLAEDTAVMRRTARVADVPDRWTTWSQAAVDGSNRLWVGLPGAMGPVSMLQVFDAAGRLLGNVPVPDPDILKGTWSHDRVYVRGESRAGFPIIRVFRLDTMPRRHAG